MKSIAQAQELKFLALTLALVVFVGTGSLFNMLRPPDLAQAQKSSRVPASLPTSTEASVPTSALSKLETLDWSCGDQEKSVRVSSARVRVKGKACGKGDLSILNETNGLTATVIDSEKGYSTDYIELSSGENHIVINWVDKKGKPQLTKFTVTKE